MVSLHQEIAENFYPQRADFTLRRSLGTEFAEHLMTSYPIIVARDLQDQIGQMLRPSNKNWFKTVTTDLNREDNEAKRWLEWSGQTMHRAMYDRTTQFARATKEGDGDFAVFGQCVLSVQLNRTAERLLYRCWHLRDVAWMENAEGKICFVARNWKPSARDLITLFPGRNHSGVGKLAEKDPFAEVGCVHMIVEADMYDDKAAGKPYFSIYYDRTHSHLIEAVPVFNQQYVIPRWQTVSGSQYAFSPAAVAGLPDARLLQSMMHTLLEAGEKAVNPPMVATQDVVRSDIAHYAGGVTWVSEEYDEKLGAALRPLEQDLRGIPLGIDLNRDIREMLGRAFYLDRLRSFTPTQDPQMTAFQAGQIVAENIRHLLPLFEPMESEYNAQLCEVTFDLMLRAGGFGSPQDLPRSLRGAEIQFRFESPLHEAIEQQKGQKFLEVHSLLKAAAELDQSAPRVLDPVSTLRDVLSGVGAPAKWIRNEEQMRQLQQDESQAVTADDLDEAAKLMQNVNKGGKATEEIAQREAQA